MGIVAEEVYPYYDRTFRRVVKNKREREALMQLNNLIDARDFSGGVDAVEQIAQKKLKERIATRDDNLLRDPIGVAVHKVLHGYDEEAVLRELEYNLKRAEREQL